MSMPAFAATGAHVASRPFHLPGAYVSQPGGHAMRGGLYVEEWTSGEPRRPWPVVMVHGGGQTGLCFTAKPDGGEGWAHAFAREGYRVYVIDEVGCGRSPRAPGLDMPTRPTVPADMVEKAFTAAADFALWPSAARHDQWPGSGRRGDPVFDRFYASQVPLATDAERAEIEATEAIVALLRRIGPAILLTHSLGGPRGWLAADRAPDLVKGIIAVEPMGSAFYWTPELAAVLGLPPDTICHPWGITRTPLAYDPPVSDPAELLAWRQPGKRGAWRLPNLARVPVAIVSGDASYHRSSDLDLAEYLAAMGVGNRLVCLEDIGIHGNGHMMMLEKNSDAIARAIMDLIVDWP